jgi:hypothetical protein
MSPAYELGPILESTSVMSIHAGSRLGANGFERSVSLAVVQPELSREKEFSSAFVEAAECFANIADPRLLGVEDVAEDGGRLFIAAPPMSGVSVARLVDRQGQGARALGPELACKIVRSAAEAVSLVAATFRGAGGLGGVSAEAVWLSTRGEVVLLPTAMSASKVPPRFRRHAVARYRAPELDRSKAAGAAADVYALGLLLWDLLCQGRARAPDTESATRALGPIIDTRVVRLVMRSLSPTPDERPVNASAFAMELAKSVRGDASVGGGEIARGAVRTAGDTIELRSEEVESLRPRAPSSRGYDVAHAPVRHISDFAKGARPMIPRPARPGLAKTRPKALTFEPRLVGPDGNWLRLAGTVRRWVVGRARSADLVALDPDMSREHFEVLLGSDGSFRVRDLGSKNGLFVNGARAVNAPLRAGDELRAGATVLKFEV